MAINRVDFGNQTIMNISDTTAEATDVAEGKVFYDKSGTRTTGTGVAGNYMDKVSSPTANDILITDANGQAIDSGVPISAIPTVDQTYNGTSTNAQSGIAIQTQVANLQNQIDGLGEPFRLQDFTQQINVTIPCITEDISNTSIPNVDIDLDVIDPTGQLNQNFAIASLAKYEVFDAPSGGNRLNVTPVCSFSMNGQRTLRVRMMCAGNQRKTAMRIAGALLLKHR